MIDDETVTEFHVLLLDWYHENKRFFPWRYTFNPYYTLISEILLQQTNAVKVVKPYNKIISKCDDTYTLSRQDSRFIKNVFKDIGLFYSSDRTLNISREIVSK